MIREMLMRQIDYEGRQRVGTSSADSGAGVLVDAKKDVFVPSEDNSLYVPNLVADAVYTFNISAKFLDGSYGAAYSVRLSTAGHAVVSQTASSPGGGAVGLYRSPDGFALFLPHEGQHWVTVPSL